jgi:isopenicillin-N epimerase
VPPTDEIARRAALGLGVAGATAAALSALPTTGTGAPDDEPYWAHVRDLFPTRSGPTNLLNSGGGATPQAVVDRLKRLIQITAEGGEKLDPALREYNESGASPRNRALMAQAFGCDADEIAFPRNAMEGLALGLLGVDLGPGDEVVTTRVDYDTCIEILRQRERREGVRLKLIDIPLPARTTEEVVAAFEGAIGKRTRMILFCHQLDKNGQVLPVRAICDMARRRGVVTVVDGAQSVGQVAVALRDLNCDVYATSLHKWFYAPRGTGFLYVRRDMIERFWPIWASWSGKPANSIAKFEDYGTCMKAVGATLPDVIAFNAELQPRRKEARLRYLRDRWSRSRTRRTSVALPSRRT